MATFLRIGPRGAVGALALTLLMGLSAPALHGQQAQADVLVLYHSLTGHTEAMARAVAEGASAVPGVRVTLKPMLSVTDEELGQARGLVLGSPTHWANLPPEVTALVNRLPYLEGVVSGVFSTAGNPGGGGEHVLVSLITALLNHGATVVGPVFEEEGGFRYGWMGASALTGPVDPGVNGVELDGARRLGDRVARVVLAGAGS